jgi:tetratricopeptide (TPR) repeat protein
MATAFVLLLLVLAIALIVALAIPRSRAFLVGRIGRFRPRRPAAPPRSVLLDRDGGETPIPDTPAAPSFRSQTERLRAQAQARYAELRSRISNYEWRETVRRYRWSEASSSDRIRIISLLFVLIVLLVVWRVPNLLPSRADRFTVLVAPFNERDGSVGQTGHEVAGQLARLLSEDASGRIRAQTIDTAPPNPQAAEEQMNRLGADAIVWGTIAPGGMLNQESLTPMLAYRPSGAFAPLAWEGYSGRFAMPEFYTVANGPVNGQIVVPSLAAALAAYSAGQVDVAFDTLGTLLQNTPTLNETLPRALRGNILWARGDYGPAANEYTLALNAAASPLGQPWPDARALLSNNLGAIQQDAGDGAAAGSFAQSISQLAGGDLGALRYNLGINFLRAGRFGDAATSIEIARRLQPPSAPLLLSLAEAYRQQGRLAEARQTLVAAQEQAGTEARSTTAELRTLLGNQLNGALAEQRALLAMSEQLQARGPLLWELQAAGQLDPAAATSIRTDLATAVRETTDLAQAWSRRSASEDAAERRIGGLLAIHQYRRASERLAERRLWDDAVNVELARMQGVVAPTGLTALWRRLIGSRTALGQSRDDLEQLLNTPPNSVDEAYYHAQAQLLIEGTAAAKTSFDQAASDYPGSAEPPYGQALVAQASGDGQQAIDYLARSIRLDAGYFPARLRLAQIAEANQEWAIAADQRTWLANERPSLDQTLKLAAALRHNGSTYHADSERLLLGIVNNPSIDESQKVPALTELGRLYYDIQDGAGARTVLERAQRAAPRDPAVAYELGRVLAAQGQTEAAKVQFERAIEYDPDPVQAHLALANFYLDRANALAEQNATNAQSGAVGAQQLRDDVNAYATTVAAADEQYRAALAAGASNPKDLELIGTRLYESGEYDGAATAYERLIKIAPNDANAQHGLARAYTQLGRLDAAQNAERKALTLNNGNFPEALAGLGDIALARERSDEAIQQYNLALQQDPNLAAAYIGLGRVSAAAGNWAVAAGHFQRAIDHDATSADAYRWLGEALLEQRDYSGAAEAYRQAIAIRRDYAEAYYGLARAQLGMSQPTEAAANLAAALAIRPGYDNAWLEQGKLNEQLGRDSAAIDAYSQAIVANGKLAEARYRRGLLYVRQEQMSLAESDLEAAISAQPNFPEAHYWLGRVYLAQDRPQAARDEFKTAINLLNGTYPDARFYQGIAEEQLGQHEAAVTSFQTALAQNAGAVWASDARSALARLGQP